MLPHKKTLLLLEGELGSGKTTFTRHLAAAMGLSGVIQSPTFNLLHVHENDSVILYHYDLYRLSPGELPDLGFPDLWSQHPLERREVHAVEWWEKAKEYLVDNGPAFLLRLSAEEDEEKRRLMLYAF